jgi:hypothetical protein
MSAFLSVLAKPDFMVALTLETILNHNSFTPSPSWFDLHPPALFIIQFTCTRPCEIGRDEENEKLRDFNSTVEKQGQKWPCFFIDFN